MIGIFDSGVGGLTVVKELQKQLPNLSFIYFGDTARTPYGTKSKETIIRYSLENTQFLINQGAKIILVACHTASSLALQVLKDKFKMPVLGVVEPAIYEALRISKHKRIGVIATKATIKSNIYTNYLTALDKNVKIFERSAALLVPIVEERFWNRPETRRIIKYYLRHLKLEHIDTLIMACTHYPFLRKAIQDVIGQRVKLINPSEVLIKDLKEYLHHNKDMYDLLDKNSIQKFYVSDDPECFKQTASWWIGKNIDAQLESSVIHN